MEEDPNVASGDLEVALFEDGDEFEEFNVNIESDEEMGRGKNATWPWEDDWDDDDDEDVFEEELKRLKKELAHLMKELKRLIQLKTPEERITQLPFEVLGQIFSSLPFEAAGVTIISSKWASLLPYIPGLGIEISSMQNIEDEQKLHNFINKVLPCSMVPLPKLVLRGYDYDEPEKIKDIINIALSERRVMHLDLKFDINEDPDQDFYFPLPLQVYTNNCLKHLKLKNVRVDMTLIKSLEASLDDVFPSLQSLHVNISPGCPGSTKKFHSSCPVLQELLLKGRISDDLDNRDEKIYVNSQSLTTLEIKLKTDTVYSYEGCKYSYNFKINAPKLKSITIKEQVLSSYKVENLESIVDARLQVGWKDVELSVVQNSILNDVFELLRGLENVQSLTLYDRTIGFAGLSFERQYLWNIDEESMNQTFFQDEAEKFRRKLPNFHRLTDLVIHVSHSYGWNYLLYLLHGTPVLKRLVVQIGNWQNDDPFDRDWQAPEEMPVCLKNTIEKVQIKGFQGREEHQGLIAHLVEISNTIGQFELIVN